MKGVIDHVQAQPPGRELGGATCEKSGKKKDKKKKGTSFWEGI